MVERAKKSGIMDHEKAHFVCLEYTFVLSIHLLSVITVSMS